MQTNLPNLQLRNYDLLFKQTPNTTVLCQNRADLITIIGFIFVSTLITFIVQNEKKTKLTRKVKTVYIRNCCHASSPCSVQNDLKTTDITLINLTDEVATYVPCERVFFMGSMGLKTYVSRKATSYPFSQAFEKGL